MLRDFCNGFNEFPIYEDTYRDQKALPPLRVKRLIAPIDQEFEKRAVELDDEIEEKKEKQEQRLFRAPLNTAELAARKALLQAQSEQLRRDREKLCATPDVNHDTAKATIKTT